MEPKKQTAGILVVQMSAEPGDKAKNLLKVKTFIEQNADKKLDLVVLPEFFSTSFPDGFEKFPEDANGGDTIKFLAELARHYNTNIVCGTVIEKDGDKLYNTCFVLDRRGEIAAKYRKINLFNYFGGSEGATITPGEDVTVVDLDFARVGVSVCFDIRYPLLYRSLIEKGAEIIVSPSAWCMPEKAPQDEKDNFAKTWEALNIARAVENFVCFVTSNLCGDMPYGLCGIGGSMITVPSGKTLKKASDKETTLYADVQTGLIRELRKASPVADVCRV